MLLLPSPVLKPAWLVTSLRPRAFSLAVFAKSTWLLRPGAPAEPAPEPEPPDADDFAPFKPKAGLLLTGTAHAPGGKPVPACRVPFAVGAWSKSLVAVARSPFVRLPLTHLLADAAPSRRRRRGP